MAKEPAKKGKIFLGKDVATYGKEGTGWVDYDPDFECGGPVGTPGRQCPYTLQERDAGGHKMKGSEGRLLHVGIASYRDPLCPKTLYNLFTKANRPQDVRVRVIQQNDPELDKDCLKAYCELMKENGKIPDASSGCPYEDQVFIHQVHASEAKGPTWARALLSHDFAEAHERRQVDTQDFCMSIDSHMDFEPHWDDSMVDMWDLADNEYAVLSTYVASTEQLGVNLNNAHQVPHLCMVTFTSQVRTHATKCANELPKPKLTNAIYGAGLVYGKCHYELKVPVDPHTPYVFDGEEFNRGARLWTHGYDIYTPHRVYVLHDYKNSQSNPVTGSWQRKHDNDAHQAALKRLNTMVDVPGGEPDPAKALAVKQSKFGLGDRRTLDQLIQFSGVDLRNKKPSIDGKNRCGNIQWVPFQEHPNGPNFLPRFNSETEQRLDPYDNASIWFGHDTNKVATAISAAVPDARRDEVTVLKVETKMDNTAHELEPVAIPHEDANLHQEHHELHEAIKAALQEEAKAAEPVMSNAEAAALRQMNDPGGLRGALLHEEAVLAHSVHGFEGLPTYIQISFICLVLGMAIGIIRSVGTGKLTGKRSRRMKKARSV